MYGNPFIIRDYNVKEDRNNKNERNFQIHKEKRLFQTNTNTDDENILIQRQRKESFSARAHFP